MLMPILILAVVLADQGTKFLVVGRMGFGGRIPVMPHFMDLCYSRNTGAAWGAFQDLNGYLVVFSIVTLTVVLLFRRRIIADSLLNNIALSLMVGGIVGNLMDRLRYGFVVDFLDFHFRTWHFPTFNIADSAICVGVGIYMAASFFGYASKKEQGGRVTPVAVEETATGCPKEMDHDCEVHRQGNGRPVER